jgi:hypothetical protein
MEQIIPCASIIKEIKVKTTITRVPTNCLTNTIYFLCQAKKKEPSTRIGPNSRMARLFLITKKMLSNDNHNEYPREIRTTALNNGNS